MRATDLAYLQGVHANRILLEADKGGGSGGGATLKDQLTESKAQLDAALKDKEKAENDLKAANDLLAESDNTKADAQTQLTEAKETIKTLEGEKAKLAAKVKELEEKDQTQDQRAAEQLSRNGVKVNVQKDNPAAAAAAGEGKKSAAELREEFDAETDPTKKAALWVKLEAALE